MHINTNASHLRCKRSDKCQKPGCEVEAEKNHRAIEVNVGWKGGLNEKRRKNISSCGVWIRIFPSDSHHPMSFHLSSMLGFWQPALKISFECCAFFLTPRHVYGRCWSQPAVGFLSVYHGKERWKSRNTWLVSYCRRLFHHTHRVLQTIAIKPQAGEANWCLMTDDYKRCVKVMYKCVVIDLFLWSMFWILVYGWMKAKAFLFSSYVVHLFM